MAIDNRAKRSSSVQVVSPMVLAPLYGDGTISQQDRAHAAHSYSRGDAGPPPSAIAAISYVYHSALGVR